MKKLQKLRLHQSWRGIIVGPEVEADSRQSGELDYASTACIFSEYNCSVGLLGRAKWRWKLFAPGTMMAEYWKWEGDRNNLVVPEMT